MRHAWFKSMRLRLRGALCEGEDQQRKATTDPHPCQAEGVALEDLWLSWRGMASEVLTTIPNAGGKEMRGFIQS